MGNVEVPVAMLGARLGGHHPPDIDKFQGSGVPARKPNRALVCHKGAFVPHTTQIPGR